MSTLRRHGSVDTLRNVREFRDCTRQELDAVARLSERIRVVAGEILTKEGRIGREYFLILAGTASVTRQDRTVNTLGPGEFFGELAAVDPGPRTATVTALSDLDVLSIGPREFATMAQIPGFRDSLLKGMERRLRSVDAGVDRPQMTGTGTVRWFSLILRHRYTSGS